MQHEFLSGHGYRHKSKTIYFKQRFQNPPYVQASLNDLDADQNTNLRVKCKVVDVDNQKFTLEIHTWWDSDLYTAECNWIAFGF